MLKKRLFAGILTVAMTVAMCFGGAVTAQASGDEPVDSQTPTTMVVKKELTMDEDVAIPNATFKFTFDKVTTGTDNVTDATKIPTIGEKTVSFTPENKGTTDKGIRTIILQTENVIPGVDQFQHAGIYRYLVKETQDTYSATDGSSVVYSSNVYYMDIYVSNDVQTAGALVIDKVLLYTTNGNGAAEDIKNDNKTSELKFKNTYNKNVGLEIQKRIEGSHAEMTKKFEFSLTIHRSPIVDPTLTTVTYNAVIENASGSQIGETLTFTAGTPKVFSLGNGEKLVFTNLPVGTTYSVSEATDGYTPSVDKTVAGTTTQNAGAEFTGGNYGLKDALVGDGVNSAVFTNTKETTIPTGILMNNLPFILMIAAAILGFAAYVAVKSHKAKR